MQRYFETELLDVKNFELPKEIYKHAIVVMRAKVGDHFELVTADQKVHLMEVTAITKTAATAKEIEVFEQLTELPVETTIVCGLSKGDKAEFIVQKGTELGADHFVFFKGEYSVAKWDDKKQKKKLARLEKIALAAAEQSHRTTIPTVAYLSSLQELTLAADEKGLIAYEEAAKEGEKGALVTLLKEIKVAPKETKRPKLQAIFGPEGGLAFQEVTALEERGYIRAGLGPRIMRAETAPLYLLFSLSFALELR